MAEDMNRLTILIWVTSLLYGMDTWGRRGGYFVSPILKEVAFEAERTAGANALG